MIDFRFDMATSIAFNIEIKNFRIRFAITNNSVGNKKETFGTDLVFIDKFFIKLFYQKLSLYGNKILAFYLVWVMCVKNNTVSLKIANN